MSALMNIPVSGEAAGKDPDPTNKMAVLTRSVQEHSCIKYVLEADEARKAALRTVQWFVDCGDDDFLLDRNIEFFQAMRNAAFLASSACATEGTPVNTGIRHCICVCLL